MTSTMKKTVNLDTLIKKYKYEEITIDQLAEMAQFTESQKALLPMFWDVVFNQSMLYLSDDLILNHLTNETGKGSVSDYYSNILKKYCRVDEDYIQIDKNHDLVIKYNAHSSSANLWNQKNTTKITTECYYAITGECYKKLLMRASGKNGDDARDYYIKLEKLVILMKDYISTCMQHKFKIQLEEQKNKLEQYKKINNKKDEVIKGMKSLVENTQISIKDEYIYIAVSPNEFKENKNIIGKTKNLKNRLAKYNCKKSGNNAYYFAYYRLCHDACQVENIVKKALIHFKVNGTEDVFQVRYEYLEAVIDAVLDGQDTWMILYDNLLLDSSSNDYYNKIIPLPAKKEIIEPS